MEPPFSGEPGLGVPRREPKIVPGGGRIRRGVVDPDALHVVTRLQEAGHEAYLVGGCVRDLLLGLEPKDFDVATDAPPNRIKRLFRNAFVIGRRFRLVHVRFPGGKVVEAATFRRDPGELGSHPDRDDAPIYDDNVFGTAVEDAFRRDFTVNALFYDPSHDRVIDHVGGLDDLEARLIRAIGDPDRRLKEDPVRMTRAVHFAARIGGTLEPSLREATLRCAAEIAKSSGSRLYAELMKILARGCAAPTLRGLFDLGILEPWMPELGGFLRNPIEWPATGGGTHEAASAGEPEDTPPSHLTWNLLGAADAWGMGARGVPESLEMSVLLGPWILSEWHSDRRRGHDFWTHAEELFRPMALRMNVPRRTSYEMREILGLQDRLREPPEQKRRQRSIVERSVFPEALAYYQLVLRARGHDLAPVEHWRAIADEVWAHERRHHEAPVAHAPTDFAPGAEDGPVRDLEEEPLVGETDAEPRRRSRRGARRGSREAGAAEPDAGAPIAEIFEADAAPASPRTPASPPAPTWLPRRLVSATAVPPAETTHRSEPIHAPAVSTSAPAQVAPHVAPPVAPQVAPGETVVRAAPPPPPSSRKHAPPPPPPTLPPSDLPFGTGIA